MESQSMEPQRLSDLGIGGGELAVWSLLAVSAGAGWYWLFGGGATFLGGVAASSFDWTQCIFGYISTLIGVFAGAGYRNLHADSNRSAPIDDFSKIANDIFRSRDLWAGIFVSPIIFGLIYRTVEGVSTSGLIAVALENGFCCHTIVTKLVERKRPPAKKKK